MVRNPSQYGARDEILIDGTAYQVSGVPEDWRNGPFRKYARLFGGIVHATRVG